MVVLLMAGIRGRDNGARIENFWLWGVRTTFVLCSQYVLFWKWALACLPAVA